MTEQMLNRTWLNFSLAYVTHRSWGAARDSVRLMEKGHCSVATETKALAPAFPEVGKMVSMFLKPLLRSRRAIYQPIASLPYGDDHHTE